MLHDVGELPQPRTAAIIQAVQRVWPDFNRRALTWADFEAVCRREAIDVSEHDDGPDGRTLRGGPPRISLRRGLTETYRTFVAWHELGHWVLHPHGSTYYFERHELDQVEPKEATFVAGLAVRPWASPPAVTTLAQRLSGDWRHAPISTVWLGAAGRRRRYRFRRFV